MGEKKNEIILFEDQGVKLEVNLKEETVWLTQAQMEELFDVKHATISEHISNIFKEGELEEKTSVGISDKSTGGRKSKIYNLIVRDIDIFKEINKKADVILKFTITSANDSLSKKIEPNVSYENGAKFVFSMGGVTLRENQREYFYIKI